MENLCKQRKMESDSDDIISQMPDEILTQILSLLNIKEAINSSVLSRRWRCLWKFTTSLNFDSYIKPKSVELLKCAMRSHICPTLDEFKVCLDLNCIAPQYIDEWIKFAIQKRVKRLEISLSSLAWYTLSFKCFKHSNTEHLTSLSLSQIGVHEKTIDYILCNCHSLERLSMSHLFNQFHLKVCGSSLKLKVLEIHQCDVLGIKLSAPNLVSFKYFKKFGIPKLICVGDNPLLAELIVGSPLSLNHDPMNHTLAPFSSQFLQLQILHLHMFWEDTMKIPEFPELINLKHLTLDVQACERQSFLPLVKLIVANPSLKKFTLQFLRLYGSKWEEKARVRGQINREELQAYTKTSKPLLDPHHCLKHVEIIGFTGSRNDAVFAKYLIKSAINLEKITIDLYHPYYKDLPPEIAIREAAIRKSAKKLEKSLSSKALLIVK